MQSWGRIRSLEGYLDTMKNGEVYYVAYDSGGKSSLLGFVSYMKKDDRHCLMTLYVRGKAEKSGVGSQLFEVFESHARGQGATEIHLNASLAFTSAWGFKRSAAIFGMQARILTALKWKPSKWLKAYREFGDTVRAA